MDKIRRECSLMLFWMLMVTSEWGMETQTIQDIWEIETLENARSLSSFFGET
jgi:hypothetical protein